jgi:hypothetical protein
MPLGWQPQSTGANEAGDNRSAAHRVEEDEEDDDDDGEDDDENNQDSEEEEEDELDKGVEHKQLPPQYGHARVDSTLYSYPRYPEAYSTPSLLATPSLNATPSLDAAPSQGSMFAPSQLYSGPNHTGVPVIPHYKMPMPRGKGATIYGTYNGPTTLHYEKIDPCKFSQSPAQFETTNTDISFLCSDQRILF